jgi:hypothetical protein
VVGQAEERIAWLCQTQPLHMLAWIGLSGAVWGVMIFEFWLTFEFLGVSPTLVEAITAMTAGRLALLAPLPGGLGALEASQVFATQQLGWGSHVGLAASLVIRARDFLFALSGALLTWRFYNTIMRPPALTQHQPVLLNPIPLTFQEAQPNAGDEHTGQAGGDEHRLNSPGFGQDTT